MSNYKEKYDDVTDTFELIPIGKYPVKVEAAAMKPITNGEQLNLELTIDGGKFSGRKLWFSVAMSDAAKGIRKGMMTALGYNTENGDRLDLLDDTVGRKAIAEVYHEEYQGVMRAKVKRLRSTKPNETSPIGNFEGEGESPF